MKAWLYEFGEFREVHSPLVDCPEGGPLNDYAQRLGYSEEFKVGSEFSQVKLSVMKSSKAKVEYSYIAWLNLGTVASEEIVFKRFPDLLRFLNENANLLAMAVDAARWEEQQGNHYFVEEESGKSQ
jgi:hypothetical protein